jgi:hypothetical protein
MWLTKVKSFANDIQSALTAEEEESTEQENITSDLTKLTELAELTTTQDKEVGPSKCCRWCVQVNDQMFLLCFTTFSGMNYDNQMMATFLIVYAK